MFHVRHALIIGLLLTSTSMLQSQTIYVSNSNASVTMCSQGGGETHFQNAVGFVQGLAFDASGNLYVAAGDVFKLNHDGSRTGYSGVGAYGQGDSYGMAFDTLGNLYTSNISGMSYNIFWIGKVAPGGGNATVFAECYGSGILDAPLGIAFDAKGNLFVANSGNNTIAEFTPGGNGTVFASTGLNHPMGLAFDSTGDLFVSNTDGNNIMKFTPEGNSTVFASTGLNNPMGLAFDSAGNLFVADSGNRLIDKFTPDGTQSIFATTAAYPMWIAIQPAPEPATLSLLGLGALAMLRRKSRGRD